jgi:hypothetical protein
MNVPNYGMLDPVPTDPAGYVSKDGMWAAVPHGTCFMILHNGKQVHRCYSYATSKTYIEKQIKKEKLIKTKRAKVKPGTSSLEAFL